MIPKKKLEKNKIEKHSTTAQINRLENKKLKASK